MKLCCILLFFVTCLQFESIEQRRFGTVKLKEGYNLKSNMHRNHFKIIEQNVDGMDKLHWLLSTYLYLFLQKVANLFIPNILVKSHILILPFFGSKSKEDMGKKN